MKERRYFQLNEQNKKIHTFFYLGKKNGYPIVNVLRRINKKQDCFLVFSGNFFFEGLKKNTYFCVLKMFIQKYD